MDDSVLAIYGTLLVSALVMSLHCIGMCGPIVVAFDQVFERVELTVAGRSPRGRGVFWAFFCYHVGRIWTYAMLGLLAGWLGAAVRHGSAWMGLQRGAGVVISVAVIISGVLLLGVIPGVKLDALLNGCSYQKLAAARWFAALTQSRSTIARLLLGIIMGFLPCGLVYAMLAVAAALPTPWHAALGMIIFGVGTLPSLTAVLLGVQFLPRRLRAHSIRIAAVLIVLVGVWMLARSFIDHEHGHDHHHSHMSHTIHAVTEHLPLTQGDRTADRWAKASAW